MAGVIRGPTGTVMVLLWLCQGLAHDRGVTNVARVGWIRSLTVSGGDWGLALPEFIAKSNSWHSAWFFIHLFYYYLASNNEGEGGAPDLDR